jgi:hypothetical protein
MNALCSEKARLPTCKTCGCCWPVASQSILTLASTSLFLVTIISSMLGPKSPFLVNGYSHASVFHRWDKLRPTM